MFKLPQEQASIGRFKLEGSLQSASNHARTPPGTQEEIKMTKIWEYCAGIRRSDTQWGMQGEDEDEEGEEEEDSRRSRVPPTPCKSEGHSVFHSLSMASSSSPAWMPARSAGPPSTGERTSWEEGGGEGGRRAQLKDKDNLSFFVLTQSRSSVAAPTVT